jgi:hypothetical protein
MGLEESEEAQSGERGESVCVIRVESCIGYRGNKNEIIHVWLSVFCTVIVNFAVSDNVVVGELIRMRTRILNVRTWNFARKFDVGTD